ncbi:MULTISPECIES: AraC family transcriptional regulator [unclassified Acinetobacter]|uniref:AraC family transcriptional regulator n=1 Tax=unclassified Acinetobacter TaxID=196816 RepID=UPI0029352692|nr:MULTISPECIES: AraC family transcriptional regulator ligand-binding domain-containing protein [unclassified Acinetobacter]WOE32394.1 AraC family transcriptional regulator ligand-binding domain-containing protein [Acinetobacter sp. SAAs470]WOE37867.1 AraC family transcriptional regulator ligand-binding domain-containing protein [Acinetobacter sp. SAAs474]
MDLLDLDYLKGTISITLVQEALICACQQGYQRDDLLIQSGIQPELLLSAKARVSISQYAALWVTLANTMNDEFFGMDSHAMRRGSYQLLSKAVLYMDNLNQALEYIVQFLNLILDDFSGKVFQQENYAFIVIQDLKATKRMFSYATYLMLIHSLMCWLTGQRLLIQKIQLKCTAPEDDHDYKVRFCENIQYEADENYIQFDVHYLKLKIKQNQTSWYQFIRQTPDNLLVRFRNPYALNQQIRKYLSQHRPSEWPELYELAQQLHMSEATIQRRLKNESTSYQQLKNDIRRDTAIELLTRSDDSLQQISDILCFHDVSAFHRAFKKWTGVSPGAYRASQD